MNRGHAKGKFNCVGGEISQRKAVKTMISTKIVEKELMTRLMGLNVQRRCGT